MESLNLNDPKRRSLKICERRARSHPNKMGLPPWPFFLPSFRRLTTAVGLGRKGWEEKGDWAVQTE